MRQQSVAAQRILIVEDETLIGLELEGVLQDAGFIPIGPISSLPGAIAAAHRGDFNAAVLDINVNGEMIWPAADILLQKSVSVMFLTGYSETLIPKRFQNNARLEKPFSSRELLDAILSLVRR